MPDVHVAHCPERVLPGRIMIEMVTNDRVVGGITPRCAEQAAAIYRVFGQGEILLTDAASAEMAKLVENAYRDVNIAFANELSLISEHLELDVWEVIRLANHHPRVNILTPGPGVGGHCIAVDPWFIVGAAPERVAADPHRARGQRPQAAPRRRAGRREVPSVPQPDRRLPRAGLQGQRRRPAREPGRRHRGRPSPRRCPSSTSGSPSRYVDALPAAARAATPTSGSSGAADAIAAADIVVLLVDHDHFKALSRSRLAGKVVYDTRGLWR